jgi:intracellular multiplication protein IcmT
MWRDTGRPVKLVFLDARACLPLLVFVVYWSWTTFYIAATGVIFFSVISWAGLTVPSTLRSLVAWRRVGTAFVLWLRDHARRMNCA